MVWPWPLDVDAYVERGQQIEAPRPACPECAGTMQGWYGYYRHLREDRDRLIWIPRVRGRECGRTQALLPWFVLPWRWTGHRAGGSRLGLSPDRCFVGTSGEHSQEWAAEGAAGGRRALSATPGTSDELGLEWLGIAAVGTAPAVGGCTGAGRAMASAARAGQLLVGNRPHHRRQAAGDQQKHALGGEGELGFDGEESQLG